MATLILAYHRVNDWSPEDALSVHPADFRKQLNRLKQGYRVVSLSELVAARTREPRLKERLAAITFDDGYFDNFLHARPILTELNCTATFFLTAGYIGTDRLLPRDEKNGNAEKDRLLTWPEVSEMEKTGFTFGSHSLSHADLANLGAEEAEAEINESKKILEERLSEPVVFFCYPFGSYAPETKKLVAEAGYRAAFVTPAFKKSLRLVKKSPVPEDLFSLKRVGVYRHTGSWQFRLKLSGRF